MSMTRKEVFSALAEDWGSVQWLCPFAFWSAVPALELDPEKPWDPDRWRPTPRPVPPGDLTWEEAKALHEAGEKVEFISPTHVRRKDPTWEVVFYWFERATPAELSGAAYRRAPEVTPKPPKMRVPLEPEDVPPGSVFRRVHWDVAAWGMIVSVLESGLVVMVGMNREPTFLRFATLATEDPNDGLISTDGGKTWEPCWKEVAV